MQKIDEKRLETDLDYCFSYLAGFIGFGEEDIKVIHGAAPLLAPQVPQLVDAVYDKLHSYDATWCHFIPRQDGYNGERPLSLEDLTLDHPQIAFRKKHLGRYLTRLVTVPYDRKMVMYLDMVGQIHTKKAGNKHIYIPLVQMNALMGVVADAVNATILSFEIDDHLKGAAIRAFSKVLWIQNDMITRHYAS